MFGQVETMPWPPEPLILPNPHARHVSVTHTGAIHQPAVRLAFLRPGLRRHLPESIPRRAGSEMAQFLNDALCTGIGGTFSTQVRARPLCDNGNYRASCPDAMTSWNRPASLLGVQRRQFGSHFCMDVLAVPYLEARFEVFAGGPCFRGMSAWRIADPMLGNPGHIPMNEVPFATCNPSGARGKCCLEHGTVMGWAFCPAAGGTAERMLDSMFRCRPARHEYVRHHPGCTCGSSLGCTVDQRRSWAPHAA